VASAANALRKFIMLDQYASAGMLVRAGLAVVRVGGGQSRTIEQRRGPVLTSMHSAEAAHHPHSVGTWGGGRKARPLGYPVYTHRAGSGGGHSSQFVDHWGTTRRCDRVKGQHVLGQESARLRRGGLVVQAC
jgi:hypothetical protein